MAQSYSTVEDLVGKAKDVFQKEYGCPPTHCGIAPGRVNLIGEHTDYNNGFVFPMALPMVTVSVGKMTENGFCRIVTNSDIKDETNKVTDIKPSKLEKGSLQWANYTKGVIANFHAKDRLESGFDAAIVTSVPIGGGLSSSAALEVSFYTLLEELTGNLAKSKKEKALACQKAEHDYAGMPCGIMDQFVSIFGEKSNAVLIDCKRVEAETIHFDDPNCNVLIINSNVKHKLTGSEYPERRAKCFEAAELLGISSLREATVAEIDINKDLFAQDDVMYRRFKHVVTENDRTERAADCLQAQDYDAFGKLMVESHNSLKNDFEVSCPELDQLVDLALKCEGVYGSRMTGGGFGGCTVTLVEREFTEKAIETIKNGYEGTATFYVCQASEGARSFTL